MTQVEIVGVRMRWCYDGRGASRRRALGASITQVPAPLPSPLPPVEPPPTSAADLIAIAEAKASAAADRVSAIIKNNEQSARFVALGLSALASIFGIYKALTPSCGDRL